MPAGLNTSGGSEVTGAPATGRRRLYVVLGVAAALAAGTALFASGRASAPESQAKTEPMPSAAAPAPSAGAAAVSAPTAVHLRVNSQPPGAKVFLDGREVGRTPFDGEYPRDGESHIVRAELPGHAPASETVVLERDHALSLALRKETPPPPLRGGRSPVAASPPPKPAAQPHGAPSPSSPTPSRRPARPLDNDNPFEK